MKVLAPLSCLLVLVATLKNEKGSQIKFELEEKCFKVGACTDDPLTVVQNIATPRDCWQKCLKNKECEFYSHFAEAQECKLFANCAQILDNCNDCSFGHLKCVPLEGHRVAVFGGFRDSAAVKLYSLDTTNELCSLPYLPSEAGSIPHAAFINDNFTICGGFLGDNCYSLPKESSTWQSSFKLKRREHAAALLTFDNEIWTLLGGSEQESKQSLAELTAEKLEFESFELESYLGDAPCASRVNRSHAIISRGRAFWYEESGRQFSRMISGPSQVVIGAACGYVLSEDFQTQFVSAGGFSNNGASNDVQVFSLDREQWFEGPRFPSKGYGSASVQYQNSFAVLGGADFNIQRSQVYGYDLKEGWIRLAMTLHRGNFFHGAISTFDYELSCH